MYQQNNFFLKFIQVPVRRFLLLLRATDRDTTLVIALNSQSCFVFAGTWISGGGFGGAAGAKVGAAGGCRTR